MSQPDPFPTYELGHTVLSNLCAPMMQDIETAERGEIDPREDAVSSRSSLDTFHSMNPGPASLSRGRTIPVPTPEPSLVRGTTAEEPARTSMSQNDRDFIPQSELHSQQRHTGENIPSNNSAERSQKRPWYERVPSWVWILLIVVLSNVAIALAVGIPITMSS